MSRQATSTPAAKVSPQAAQQLLKVIEHDCQLAQQLKTVLQEEKTLLERRQYNAHSELVKQKTRSLIQLEEADQQRRQIMSEMGFSADKAGFDLFLKQVPASWQQRFSQNWDTLSDTMNTCGRLNKVNGKILAHAQNSMERLMTIIKGTVNQVAIYQANGRKSLNAEHRMLVTA
ncbi:flagellar protein FlgN [Ketobacter sp. MCCC 1A13808]|uniref:flagella synthesis protein FlgN n=1 Tax=Ketobacter sp. MCCC 1A13808 TaxID=2602738 RepID=UPI000F1CCF40|nr:flagellar protein FlgN [Ketobacter sp. MCCC 1A13808]MVF12806.1 flagellar protein FlgN [Ketobacter sp. MCCC 1A13808]RLP54519.1 MAG: flagellar protein FlgN [Ketobacter sp.]